MTLNTHTMSCINICFVSLMVFFLSCSVGNFLIMADRSYFILSFVSTVLHLTVRQKHLRILPQPHLDNHLFASFRKLTYWIWTYGWSEAVFPYKKWQLWGTSDFCFVGIIMHGFVVEQWFHLVSDTLFVFNSTIKRKMCLFSSWIIFASHSPPLPINNAIILG